MDGDETSTVAGLQGAEEMDHFVQAGYWTASGELCKTIENQSKLIASTEVEDGGRDKFIASVGAIGCSTFALGWFRHWSRTRVRRHMQAAAVPPSEQQRAHARSRQASRPGFQAMSLTPWAKERGRGECMHAGSAALGRERETERGGKSVAGKSVAGSG